MNKHGQRRKETCPCTANLTFLVQNYIFLSIFPQIYSDYCGFLTPKVQRKRAMAPGKPRPAPHSSKRTSASSKLFSAGPGTRKQSSRFRETEGQQRAVLKDVPQLRIRKKCVTTQKIRMKTPEQANNSGFMGYSTLIYPHIQY